MFGVKLKVGNPGRSRRTCLGAGAQLALTACQGCVLEMVAEFERRGHARRCVCPTGVAGR